MALNVKSLSIVVTAVLVAGCTSINVTKVDPTTPHGKGPVGQRFSLPIPALLVTPTGDGGISVDRKDLPDPSNTFAIDGWALFAKYSLTVETKNGVLSEVKWAPDSSAVLSQAVTSAGSVAADAIKARRSDQAADQEAITGAKLDAAVAQTEYDSAVAQFGKDSPEARAAKIALDKALAKLAFLKGEAVPASVANDLARVASDPDRTKALSSSAPGPMLLLLHVDDDGRPSLRPAQFAAGNTPQVRFPIAGTSPPATPPDDLNVIPGEAIVIARPAAGDLKTQIELTAATAGDIAVAKLEDVDTLNVYTEKVLSLTRNEDNAKKLTITLARSLSRGTYLLRFFVTKVGASARKELSVKLDVQ